MENEIILVTFAVGFLQFAQWVFSNGRGPPPRTAITKNDMPPKKRWGEIGARLATMSWDEIRTRGLQEIRKRLDTSAYRLGIDPCPVLPRGVAQPTGNFFFSTEERSQIIALLRHRLPHMNADIIRRAEQICEHRFDLLGYRNIQYGPEIDWHLDPIHRKSAPRNPWYQIAFLDINDVGDHKLIWELNRHQHLVTLGKAYCLTEEERFLSELFREWRHWQRENPYSIGINWASSLEAAFRALSWLWVRFLLPSFPEAYEPDWSRALMLSARHIEDYLSTYFAPNTHLLGEGVALFAIGTLYPQLPSASRWKERGWQIVLREVERQVRSDGVHIEQSTYYHVYALDFFLHARILAARNNVQIPTALDEKIQKMLDALRLMAQAGCAPRFGDDDGGRVFDPLRNRPKHMLDPLSTGAALYGRADLKAASPGLTEETLWLLGPKGVARFDELVAAVPAIESVALQASGLYIMASSEPFPRQLIIDAGPQGTGNSGHGHADALSIQISFNGREWLTDPGTFCYVSRTNERNLFRGTAAHNTLQVDERDQAVAGGPFIWTAQPKVCVERWSKGKTFDLFLGKHTGYCRLLDSVLHRRWVFNLKSRFWLVRDIAEGTGEHKLDLFWHFAARVDDPHIGENAASCKPVDGDRLLLLTAEEHGWSEKTRADRVSPCYGNEEPSLTAHFSTRKRLPAEFVSLIAPASVTGKLTQWEETKNQAIIRAYRFCGGGERHDMLFGDQDGFRRLGPWMSDARFMYSGFSRNGRQHLILCAGSFLEFGGNRIVNFKHHVEWFEWSSTGAAGEFDCSDASALTQLHLPILVPNLAD